MLCKRRAEIKGANRKDEHRGDNSPYEPRTFHGVSSRIHASICLAAQGYCTSERAGVQPPLQFLHHLAGLAYNSVRLGA